MNLEVLFDDCLAVDRPVLGSTLLCVFGPSILQGSKDPHIEWLEFVGCFRGEAVKDDGGAGSVAESLHFRGFMRYMTINDKKNGSAACVVSLCKRDEDLAKPLSTNFIGCPTLVQGSDPKKEKKEGQWLSCGMTCTHEKRVNLPAEPRKPQIINADLPLRQHKQWRNMDPICRDGLQQCHQDQGIQPRNVPCTIVARKDVLEGEVLPPPPQLNSLLILLVDILRGYLLLDDERLQEPEVAFHSML